MPASLKTLNVTVPVAVAAPSPPSDGAVGHRRALHHADRGARLAAAGELRGERRGAPEARRPAGTRARSTSLPPGAIAGPKLTTPVPVEETSNGAMPVNQLSDPHSRRSGLRWLPRRSAAPKPSPERDRQVAGSPAGAGKPHAPKLGADAVFAFFAGFRVFLADVSIRRLPRSRRRARRRRRSRRLEAEQFVFGREGDRGDRFRRVVDDADQGVVGSLVRPLGRRPFRRSFPCR